MSKLMKMGSLDYYMPIVAMVMIEFIYAGLGIGTRTVFVQGMSPMIFVVYRHAFATIIIAPIAYFSGRNSGSNSLNLRSFFLISLTTLFGVTLNQNLFFEGVYLASSSVASAMANLVPAITFVIATSLGMEKVNIRSMRSIAKIVGTVMCVSGAVSMALLKGPKLLNAENLPSKSIKGSASESENWLLGCLCLFGSCCAWSVWLILQVPASASHPNYLSFSAWMCFLATLQTTVVTLFFQSAHLNAWKINSLLEFAVCLYAGVGSALTFCLQAWCISKRGPLFSAMFNPLFTLIVTILAALLLHEKIYVGSLIGAIGVIIGLYIVLWGKAEEVLKKVETNHPAYNKTDLEEPLVLAADN